MTPEQALNLVFQIAALAPVNKQTHKAVEDAVKVLIDAIKPADDQNG